MNVVDSSAWLEYFADGPNADSFAAAIVVLATARHDGAVVWTQDADFEGLDGVTYVPKGRRSKR
jgi:predicted nuclease of predicted toxin-antitoxin system